MFPTHSLNIVPSGVRGTYSHSIEFMVKPTLMNVLICLGLELLPCNHIKSSHLDEKHANFFFFKERFKKQTKNPFIW